MGDYAWITWIGWALVGFGALGVLLWLARRSRKGSRLCPNCDYDMSATSGLTCPECAKTARSERALARRRRKRAWRRIGVALLVLGAGVLVFNPNRREGWATSLPDWAIWPVVPWFDDYADAWISAYEASRLAQTTNLAMATSSDPGRWELLLTTRQTLRELKATAGPGAPRGLPLATFVAQSRARTPVGRDMLGVEPSYVIDSVLDLVESQTTVTGAGALLRYLDSFAPLDAMVMERLRAILRNPDHRSIDAEAWSAGFSVLLHSIAEPKLIIPDVLAGLEVANGSQRSELVRLLYDLVPLEDHVLKVLEARRSSDPDQAVRAGAGAVLWKNETAAEGSAVGPR